MTDVRIIPNLSDLPGTDVFGNQASSAETGTVKAAVFAKPEAFTDSSKEIGERLRLKSVVFCRGYQTKRSRSQGIRSGSRLVRIKADVDKDQEGSR